MIGAITSFFEFIVNIFKFIVMVLQGLINLITLIVQIPSMILGITVNIPPVLAFGVSATITFAIILKCVSMFWGVGKND